MLKKSLLITITTLLLTTCVTLQPASTPTSTPMPVSTSTTTPTLTLTLEPWMQSLPENVNSVEIDGEQILGLNAQGNPVMTYNLDTNKWTEVSSLEPVPVVEIKQPDWFVDSIRHKVEKKNVVFTLADGRAVTLPKVAYWEHSSVMDGFRRDQKQLYGNLLDKYSTETMFIRVADLQPTEEQLAVAAVNYLSALWQRTNKYAMSLDLRTDDEYDDIFLSVLADVQAGKRDVADIAFLVTTMENPESVHIVPMPGDKVKLPEGWIILDEFVMGLHNTWSPGVAENVVIQFGNGFNTESFSVMIDPGDSLNGPNALIVSSGISYFNVDPERYLEFFSDESTMRQELAAVFAKGAVFARYYASDNVANGKYSDEEDIARGFDVTKYVFMNSTFWEYQLKVEPDIYDVMRKKLVFDTFEFRE